MIKFAKFLQSGCVFLLEGVPRVVAVLLFLCLGVIKSALNALFLLKMLLKLRNMRLQWRSWEA